MSKLEKKFEEFLPNTGDEIVELVILFFSGKSPMVKIV